VVKERELEHEAKNNRLRREPPIKTLPAGEKQNKQRELFADEQAFQQRTLQHDCSSQRAWLPLATTARPSRLLASSVPARHHLVARCQIFTDQCTP